MSRIPQFFQIAREQIIGVLEELRETVKVSLGGDEPVKPYETIVAGPGEKLPTLARIPRNFPCPCGSGKRFKNCHGKPLRRR